MKILHVIPVYEPAWGAGGVVRTVSQLCRGLAKLGVDVTVFATDFGNGQKLPVPVDRMVEVGGVKVWYFKTDFLHKFAYSRSLRETLRHHTQEFDLIAFSTFWCYPGIPAGMEARKHGVPYVMFPGVFFLTTPWTTSISRRNCSLSCLKRETYAKPAPCAMRWRWSGRGPYPGD